MRWSRMHFPRRNRYLAAVLVALFFGGQFWKTDEVPLTDAAILAIGVIPPMLFCGCLPFLSQPRAIEVGKDFQMPQLVVPTRRWICRTSKLQACRLASSSDHGRLEFAPKPVQGLKCNFPRRNSGHRFEFDRDRHPLKYFKGGFGGAI